MYICIRFVIFYVEAKARNNMLGYRPIRGHKMSKEIASNY